MFVHRFKRGLERTLEAVVIFLLAALTTLIVVAVVFRKAGAALVWYDEVASILLAWLTYYGSALAVLRRSHIGFGTLVERLPSAARTTVTVSASVIVIGFFAAAAWAGWLVILVLGDTYLVSLPWVPLRLTQSVIPIGAALCMIAEALTLVDRDVPAPA